MRSSLRGLCWIHLACLCFSPVCAAPDGDALRQTRISGDVNCDGILDLSDAVFTLNYLFLGTDQPPCPLADSPELLAEIAALEASASACNDALALLEAEAEALRSTAASLEAELAASQAELAAARSELVMARTELEACRAELPAPPEYTLTGLGFLGGKAGVSLATAVNNRGEVVGYTDNARIAFLWRDGQLTDLGALPESAGEALAYGINDDGAVVGVVAFPSVSHAFRHENEMMTDLGAGHAHGINQSRQVVGWFDNRATLWQGVSRISLGTLMPDGSGYSHATAINELGQIVGGSSALVGSSTYSHACFWQNGIMTDLGVLPGGSYSEAWDINAHGQIVGYASLPFAGSGSTPNRPVLWQTFTSPVQKLADFLGDEPIQHGEGRAINDHGFVVGAVYLGNGDLPNPRAFVWDPVNGLRDLNTLVDRALGWRLTFAMDINESGQIVGQGVDADGWTQPFLLTPRA